MFRGWGFLLGEIWVLIALAALIGLFIGWLVWGRGTRAVQADDGDAQRLQGELDACRARGRDATTRISRLEAELAAITPVSAPRVEPVATPTVAAPVAAESTGTRPARLDTPRGGTPDDLKRIKGIGPKLEALCNRLGFWHFEQIAGWSADEIAWVDANLEAFKGRVTRDDWVAQARILAAETPQG